MMIGGALGLWHCWSQLKFSDRDPLTQKALPYFAHCVWVCGRVGVWACGRVGVWVCGYGYTRYVTNINAIL